MPDRAPPSPPPPTAPRMPLFCPPRMVPSPPPPPTPLEAPPPPPARKRRGSFQSAKTPTIVPPFILLGLNLFSKLPLYNPLGSLEILPGLLNRVSGSSSYGKLQLLVQDFQHSSPPVDMKKMEKVMVQPSIVASSAAADEAVAYYCCWETSSSSMSDCSSAQWMMGFDRLHNNLDSDNGFDNSEEI
nr:ethylene-responsive transcription factor RAP2-13-like [Ipomoea batatas]